MRSVLAQRVLTQAEKFFLSAGLTDTKVVVACSGGPDSLVLLDTLVKIREKCRLCLTAAHFDHGLRGLSGHLDAAFVARFCAGHLVPFRLGNGDTKALAEKQKLSVETAARELRLRFLRAICRQTGSSFIVTAHHLNDQAETVLMRLIVGTGLTGLGGMRMRQGDILRPLLRTTRAEILAYVQANGLMPRHDATNDLPLCTRNKIRLNLLPRLRRDYNPQIDRALVRLADLAAEAEDYFERIAQECWSQAIVATDTGQALLKDFLIRQHPAVQRALIRRMVREMVGVPQNWRYEHFERLRVGLIEGESGCNIVLPGGWYGQINYDRLYLRRVAFKGMVADFSSCPLKIPGVSNTPWGTFTADLVNAMPELSHNREIYFDRDELPGELIVRGRRDGDNMLTSGGRKSLKKIFQEAKISADLRTTLPIVAFFHRGDEKESSIIWLPGIRRSIHAYVNHDTKTIVRLVFTDTLGYFGK